MTETLGIYLSVPFCKAKCSFCNFASGVFAAGQMQGYVDFLCAEMNAAPTHAAALGVALPSRVDSVYLGGGTPSLLEPVLLDELFATLRSQFEVAADAEITIECAPGQIAPQTLAAMQRLGVNRLSFGVQSFVDAECAAVGRLHTGFSCREELARMTRAGMSRLGLDLIVGLPGQTLTSWRYSIDQAIASGVEHVSLYMLEVDEDSRLGREKLAGGARYGAATLPEDDAVADWYAAGCEWLETAGLRQYEISNFARTGGQSRHNRKYWERAPYLGFGMDAHSMLRDGVGGVRWANPDTMEAYESGPPRQLDRVDEHAAAEEHLFLGLRLVEGIASAQPTPALAEMADAGLVEVGERIRLTARGRMISNEVFGRLLEAEQATANV